MKTEDRYTIIGELGAGGFGSVYKARDEMLRRDVAVKRLDDDNFSEDVRKQLIQEARLLASMKHPNIVSIYDISSKEDHDEIVMELLEGISLDRLPKKHLLQASDVRNIAGQILNALDAAHEADILHCDLKPENIMLCLSGSDHYESKVYDFGLSVSSEIEETEEKKKLLGSIYVMAPELFNGDHPTRESDLYSLGCILYYLFVGQYPFIGESSIQVMASHITGNHIPLSTCRRDLPSELCLWVSKLFEKDPKDRYRNCKDALHDLRNIYLPKDEATFTLPTSLELEGGGSRLVRNISKESLNPEGEFHSGENTTVFLDNTFKESSLVKEKPALPDLSNKTAVQPSLLTLKTEEQYLPEDAEWYFTIGDKTKGPVNVEQLKKLCLEGKLLEENLVWHSLFGDWVPAVSCAETQEAFAEKKAIADAKVAKLEAEQLQLQQEREAEKLEVKKEQYSWMGAEFYGFIATTLIVGVFYFTHPEIRRYTVPFYCFVLLALGLSASRIYQRRARASWGYFLPVVGDVFFALKEKRMRLTIGALMVLTGSVGLVFAGVKEVGFLKKKEEASNAVTDFDIKLFKQNEGRKAEDRRKVAELIEEEEEKAAKLAEAQAEKKREIEEIALAEKRRLAAEEEKRKGMLTPVDNESKNLAKALEERRRKLLEEENEKKKGKR